MEQIFAFVDEAGKKLNRQIKDLDDIRIAMEALKEIREHQISIDFQVGPIEVKHSVMSLIQYGVSESFRGLHESISECVCVCIYSKTGKNIVFTWKLL